MREISVFTLAGLCRRMATALGAGLDVRRVVEREASAARGTLATRLIDVRAAVDRGGELATGMRATNGYFPPLVCEMVGVGEKTGQLAEVFRQLADHLEFQRELRRSFMWSIVRPGVQFLAALLIVGFLIVFMGTVAPAGGKPVDMLGFGFTGASGLLKYLIVLGVVFVVSLAVWRSVRYLLRNSAGFQSLVMRIPILGAAVRTLALERFCWTLSLTTDSAMELRKALALALASTHNGAYRRAEEPIWRRIASGGTLHDGLAGAGLFPADMLSEIDVGEQSGRLSQTLATLARLYRADAQSAMRGMATLATWAIWILVSSLLIFLIFRLANFYFSSFSAFA